MAIILQGDYVEVFKFPESGWFALFEEVLDFRKEQVMRGHRYSVNDVGINDDGNYSVKLRLD